MKSKKKQQNI